MSRGLVEESNGCKHSLDYLYKSKHFLINDISHRIEFLRLDVPRSISVLSESEAVILQEC